MCDKRTLAFIVVLLDGTLNRLDVRWMHAMTNGMASRRIRRNGRDTNVINKFQLSLRQDVSTREIFFGHHRQNPECESVRDFTFYLLLLHYYLESHSGLW